MKKEDMEKTICDLECEKDKNELHIDECNKRKNVAKFNRFERKLGYIGAYAFLSYLPLMAGLLLTIRYGDISFLSNLAPGITLPIGTIVIPSIIGIAVNKIVDKKYNIKNRLKEFSSAKNEAEKIEEEIKNLIEIEKTSNRNNAISKSINCIKENCSILDKFSSKYDIKEKEDVSENVDADIKELSQNLKCKEKELDILCTKKVLANSFHQIRIKTKIFDTLVYSMVGGLMLALSTAAPTLALNNIGKIQISSFSPLFPFFIGYGASVGFFLKRNNDYKKVFNRFNSELGFDRLSNYLDNEYNAPIEEINVISKQIEDKVSEISMIVLELQEKKINLLSHNENDEEKTKINISDKEYKPIEITEETRKEVLEHPEKYASFPARIRMGLFYTDEEYEQYIEKVLSKQLPGDEEKGKQLTLKRNNKNRK